MAAPALPSIASRHLACNSCISMLFVCVRTWMQMHTAGSLARPHAGDRTRHRRNGAALAQIQVSEGVPHPPRLPYWGLTITASGTFSYVGTLATGKFPHVGCGRDIVASTSYIPARMAKLCHQVSLLIRWCVPLGWLPEPGWQSRATRRHIQYRTLAALLLRLIEYRISSSTFLGSGGVRKTQRSEGASRATPAIVPA